MDNDFPPDEDEKEEELDLDLDEDDDEDEDIDLGEDEDDDEDIDLGEDEDDDEDIDLGEDEETEPEEVTELEEETSSEEPEEEATPEAPPVAIESKEEIVNPQELELQLSIEVGRVSLSMKQLMELKPGNLLELGVQPDVGVDLVLNDRVVGRGELLKIGETLGVRILEKG